MSVPDWEDDKAGTRMKMLATEHDAAASGQTELKMRRWQHIDSTENLNSP